jgi:hypothetical protein
MQHYYLVMEHSLVFVCIQKQFQVVLCCTYNMTFIT